MPDELARQGGRLRRWALWGLVLLAALLVHLPFLQKAARPLTASERALAAVARQALRSGDAGFDYGGFFLHAEGAAGGDIERRWRRLVGSLREQVGSLGGRHADSGIATMMLALFREAHLGRYHREEARLSGFFSDDAGGNCEAQTKLLVASLRGSSMQLPDGKELGVEVFQDHVQAVLVDRRRKVLWNLLTGEEDAAPRSDVYRPAVLLAAYLRGLGERPPVAESELRLLRGPRPQVLHRGWGFFTTSTMKLPAAVARFAEGPVPERAEVPLPVARRPAEPLPPGVDKVATWRDEYLRSNDPVQLFAMDRVDSPFGLIGPTVVFRHQEHAERYLALKTDPERRALLLALTEAQIRAELSTGLITVPPIEQIFHGSEASLIELLQRIRRVEQLVNLTENAVDRGRGGSMVAGELELRLPELGDSAASVRAFTADAAQEPARFFHRLSQLERPRRRALLAFFFPRFQSAQVKALAQAIGDPERVELVPGESSPPPARAPLVFTDVDLIDVPLSAHLPPPPASPAPPAPSAAAPGPERSPAETLSAGAYLDVVLSGLVSSGTAPEALPGLRRWTPAVSEQLAQLTPAGAPCAEAHIHLAMSALRPFRELNLPPPAPLAEAERRLDRGCKK